MPTKIFAAIALCALALGVTACGTLQAAPSLFDDGVSPRRTTVAGIDTVVSSLDRMSLTVGVLPAPFLDDVGQFADRVERVATAYLDATEACVVIDGALQTDPTVGGACDGSAVKRAFGDVSQLLADAVIAAGPTDTGRALLVASLLLDGQLKPSSGDMISGYQKREDLSREVFQAARAKLKASFDRFRAAAAGALAAR